jgi:LuxR family transcriptional regulator, maltose regulon positive regulatory protein
MATDFPGKTALITGGAVRIPRQRRDVAGDTPVTGGVAGPGAGGVVSRPGLFGRVGRQTRVTVVSAPPGSGKTVLLRSWIGEARLAGRAAWVTIGRDERDPQQFWLSVVGALRQTSAGARLVRPLAAAPDLDGRAVMERLLKDLAPLGEPVWLVLDDVQELGSDQGLRQLELLLLRAPPELRFVLATRQDLRLGLHRLRLEGELTEIRAADLRFTVDEARALFAAAGVQLPEGALAQVHQRTEGWAAGLRLAALSLAGHPDPGRFAAEFSGTERTVAEYLVAEVLDRQPEEVRLLLLRTSILERISGALADLLTGGSAAEAILQDLEEAGAFVVSLDAARSGFRYHQMFADLLRLELRCTRPAELPVLHSAAAKWHAEHGYPVEAVRHAQAAQDWDLAARLLSDHWLGLHLDGQGATAHELLASFPADIIAADAELAALQADDELLRGSLEAAERYLARALHGSASVPAGRRSRFQAGLTVRRLSLARERGDLPAVVTEAQRLLAPAADAAQLELGPDLRGLALVSLGIAELWALRAGDAELHLEQASTLARQIGRPWLEVRATAHAAWAASFRSFALAEERSMQAIKLADEHGWSGEPVVAVAYAALGVIRIWQMRLEEAETLLGHAGRALRAEVEPAAGLVFHQARGMLALARGSDADALAAFRAAERLSGLLVTEHPRATPMRAHMLQTLVRAGETGHAEAIIAELDGTGRGEMRNALAALRIAQGDPQAAADALAPVVDGSALVTNIGWLTQAFLLEAIARDALGCPDDAGRALEHALDLAQPDGLVFAFILHPAPALLEHRITRRTAHAALISEILTALAGKEREPAPDSAGSACGLYAPLSDSEIRVLRYLPSHLSAQEIASELYVSVNTVKTHMRSLYAKLGAHRRHEAVQRARALGLLTPSTRA